MYIHGEEIWTSAWQAWEKDSATWKGAAMFNAKFAALCLASAGWFSAVVYVLLEAAKRKDESNKVLMITGASLLIICAGYTTLHYYLLQEDFKIKAAVILWAKSTAASALWVAAFHQVSKSRVASYHYEHFDHFPALAGFVLLIWYTWFILAYMRKDWTAGMKFFDDWFKYLVLAEVPILGLAAVRTFAIYVHGLAAELISRDRNENIASGTVATGMCAGICYLASSVSVDAYEPDGCSYTCCYKLEAAAMLFACGISLILIMVENLAKIQIVHPFRELMAIGLIVLMCAVVAFVHGFELPKWLKHFDVYDVLKVLGL